MHKSEIIVVYSIKKLKKNVTIDHCTLFLGTRTRKRTIEMFGVHETPKIVIGRNVELDAILLKRQRIVNRRVTLAESMVIQPLDQRETTDGHSRMIFGVGRPSKEFRSISNRRKSTPAVTQSQQTPIELFNAPITKSNDDGDCIRIRFDDINFGRLSE